MKAASLFLLCLALAGPAAAQDAAPAAALGAKPPATAPATDIVGFVSPMQGAGICMDGATHLIHAVTGDFRLKPANPEAAQALAAVANGKERVTVTGHRVTGPECIYFAVERVTRGVPE